MKDEGGKKTALASLFFIIHPSAFILFLATGQRGHYDERRRRSSHPPCCQAEGNSTWLPVAPDPMLASRL
jgi:hypothetical protein